MDSIFSKIIKGEIPSYKILENDSFIAFLDVFPLKKGHTLVVPKKQVDYLFDLDEDTYTRLWSFAKEVEKCIGASFDCKKVGVAVVGLEVPHVHIHLIPINSVSDMDFSQPKLQLSPEEFCEVQNTMISNI